MMFVLGFIAGTLIILVILALDIYLWLKKDTATERLVSQIDRGYKPQAQIIQPPRSSLEAFDKALKKNDSLGIDTKIKDLLDD